MKITSDSFKKGFVETNVYEGLNPAKISQSIKQFYNENSISLGEPPYSVESIKKFKEQAQKICDRMVSLGFVNFSGLMGKFEVINSETAQGLIEQTQLIKDTMEAILFFAMSNKNPGELAKQYQDRVFLCANGTLTNLQVILAEMLLGGQGIDSYIINQKKQLVTQTAADMYRRGNFIEFPLVWRMFRGTEIHNITALVNTVAPEYNLLVKTKKEDKFLRYLYVTSYSQKKLSLALETKLKNAQAVDTFLDSVAMDVISNFPTYMNDKYNDMRQFTNEVIDAITRLKIPNLTVSALIKIKDNGLPDGYKENLLSVMKDVVTVYLHEKGVIYGTKIEMVKLRVQLEQDEDIDGIPCVCMATIEDVKSKGLLEPAFKYMIDNNLVLNKYDFNNIDPIQYAYENNITISGKNAKQYGLERIIEKYLKVSNPQEKALLQSKYEALQQMGLQEKVKLLPVDSQLGKLLSSEKSIQFLTDYANIHHLPLEKNVDLTKCDILLIEKLVNTKRGESKDYDKFSIPQIEVSVAAGITLGVIGSVISYLMINQRNLAEKKKIEDKLNIQLSSIKDDLASISHQKFTSKEQRGVCHIF